MRISRFHPGPRMFLLATLAMDALASLPGAGSSKTTLISREERAEDGSGLLWVRRSKTGR